MNPATRNNLLAGTFLVGAVVLCVWLTFTLSDRGTPGARLPIVIRFELSVGAHGLKDGSAVLLGGQKIGQVTRAKYHTEPPSERFPEGKQYIDVLTMVRDDLKIGPAAVANLDRPLLGSISTINISALGSSKAAGTVSWGKSELNPDAMVIKGGLAPPAVLQQAGFGTEQAGAVETAVNDLGVTSRKIREAVEENTPKFNELVNSTQAIVARVEGKMPVWTERVDTIIKNAETSSADWPAITEKLKKQVDELDGIIARNKDKVDNIVSRTENAVASADEAMAKVNRESINTFNQTLKEAQEALAKLQAPLTQVRDFINEDLPQVKTTLANTRLMSEQLKLTATEVRAQPWRLLIRPDTRELSIQLLFDSARSYASAMSDLRAATQELSAAQSSDSPGRTERVNTLAQQLEDALKRARTAEDIFLKRMSEK